jgi:hypothetical protein
VVWQVRRASLAGPLLGLDRLSSVSTARGSTDDKSNSDRCDDGSERAVSRGAALARMSEGGESSTRDEDEAGEELADGSAAIGSGNGHAREEGLKHADEPPADPVDVSAMIMELRRRLTYETPVAFERGSGYPINPRGRTGMRGRGEVRGRHNPR